MKKSKFLTIVILAVCMVMTLTVFSACDLFNFGNDIGSNIESSQSGSDKGSQFISTGNSSQSADQSPIDENSQANGDSSQNGGEQSANQGDSDSSGAAGDPAQPIHEHDYRFVEFVWDGFTAQAKCICANDNSHVEYYNVTVSSKVTTAPTCTTAGEKVYTASFDDNTVSVKETLGALGHNWKTEYDYNDNKHWHSCLRCGETTDVDIHTFVNNQCNVCGKITNESDVITALAPFIYSVEDGQYIIESVKRSHWSDKKLVIPNYVSYIDENALANCEVLEDLTIPFVGKSVKKGNYDNPFGVIFGTTDLSGTKPITQYYYGIDGQLLSSTYYLPTTLKSVNVTGGRVYYGAFKNCDMIETIVIDGSVGEIGEEAFANCSSLKEVTVCGNVKSIGNYAFQNCRNLTSITIPDSVTSIGSSAFYGCSSLEEITIPFVGNRSGVTASDTYQYPFGYIFGTSSYTGGVATTQYYYGSSTSYTTSTKCYIPASLRSVTVTGGNILYGAFYNCSSLTSVTIGNGVTSIGDRAFYGCSGLTSVTIPDSVTSIHSGAFYGCYKLVEVYNKSALNISTGSSSFGYIGYYAKNIYSPSEGQSKLSTNDNGYIIYTDGDLVSLIGYTGNETELVLPDNITEIYENAFRDCSGLTSVTIVNGVTSIPSGAFYNCSSLTSITIPDSVTSIGSSAFYN
ncbi:MAG: leucine-rich repeat domain-containing protein, partial [Clostridia bacterium]|nr:leucine-rich repeat domain-containing protein [Clostridia bacterium]